MPVRLRAGGRTIGGAMSWGEPKRLRAFGPDSPFFGLPVPDEVQVSAQVMAQPDPDLPDRVIASLADGTPLVTRKRVGAGQVVLVPLSPPTRNGRPCRSRGSSSECSTGFAVSTRPAALDADDLAGTTWQPDQVLTGFGEVRDAGVLAGVPGERLAEGGPRPRPAPRPLCRGGPPHRAERGDVGDRTRSLRLACPPAGRRSRRAQAKPRLKGALSRRGPLASSRRHHRLAVAVLVVSPVRVRIRATAALLAALVAGMPGPAEAQDRRGGARARSDLGGRSGPCPSPAMRGVDEVATRGAHWPVGRAQPAHLGRARRAHRGRPRNRRIVFLPVSLLAGDGRPAAPPPAEAYAKLKPLPPDGRDDPLRHAGRRLSAGFGGQSGQRHEAPRACPRASTFRRWSRYRKTTCSPAPSIFLQTFRAGTTAGTSGSRPRRRMPNAPMACRSATLQRQRHAGGDRRQRLGLRLGDLGRTGGGCSPGGGARPAAGRPPGGPLALPRSPPRCTSATTKLPATCMRPQLACSAR